MAGMASEENIRIKFRELVDQFKRSMMLYSEATIVAGDVADFSQISFPGHDIDTILADDGY